MKSKHCAPSTVMTLKRSNTGALPGRYVIVALMLLDAWLTKKLYSNRPRSRSSFICEPRRTLTSTWYCSSSCPPPIPRPTPTYPWKT